MGYIVIISIILIYSAMQTITFKKRIEQTIPISIVEIILTVYIAGIFNNLKIGITIIEIMAGIQLAIILFIMCKAKSKEKVIEILERIVTPGVLVYIILCGIFIYINKDRIFLDYDEFTHWGVIVKNMFMYNTYGTNSESIVRFNEYPPLTAIFQYIFLSIKNIYSEDMIITAQNILYLSIIIPITQKITWSKKITQLILVVPCILAIPIIFYKNFYLDILVDGILGIMFATTLFYEFEREENQNFKYIKIFSGIIMLCLTKTSGICLAILLIAILIIKTLIDRNKESTNFKKDIIKICAIIMFATILTTIWYIKVKNTTKRWDFNQYVETNNKTQEQMQQVATTFIQAIFRKQEITEKEFTLFSVFLVLICTNMYLRKKQMQENYKYYSNAMLLSVVIYIIFLLITYMTIFDISEASILTCFDRYISTILLATTMFQALVLCNLEPKINTQKIVVIIAILICLLPQKNIQERYLNKKTHIEMATTKRDVYTKLRRYRRVLNKESSILYLAGSKQSDKVLASINQYEIMPIRITKSMIGEFYDAEAFKQILNNGNYTHVYIYRMRNETKEKIKSLFKNNVANDILYKVIKENGEVSLEKE